MATEVTQRTEDERRMAGLAHASVVLNLLTGGLGGIIAALVIWLTQRKESDWVGFQAFQALVYQIVGLAVSFLGFMCWFALWFVSLFPVMANPNQYNDAPPAGFFLSFSLLCIPFVVGILWTLYGLWGGLRTWQGHDFRYVVLGSALKGRADTPTA